MGLTCGVSELIPWWWDNLDILLLELQLPLFSRCIKKPAWVLIRLDLAVHARRRRPEFRKPHAGPLAHR